MIDVNRRMMSSSTTFKAIRRSALITDAVFIAVLTYWMNAGPLTQRLLYATAAVAAWCVVYPFIHRAGLKRRLRSYWKEHLGSDGPFVVEVGLSDAGVRLWQFRTETLTPWSMVKSVEEKDEAVEIAVRQGGLIVVRDRAFATPGEKRRFIELGRAYLSCSESDLTDTVRSDYPNRPYG